MTILKKLLYKGFCEIAYLVRVVENKFQQFILIYRISVFVLKFVQSYAYAQAVTAQHEVLFHRLVFIRK